MWFIFFPLLGHPSFHWTDGESKTKAKKDTSKGKAKRKKRKSNDNEALEDSDDGDYEGLEVDYMSDESRSDSLPVAFEEFFFTDNLICHYYIFHFHLLLVFYLFFQI